jgi:cytosine/adenosine deaminase-related metal-dependent hydrolase
MHDELQLMVDAGLSTLTVLQSATINAAKFLGKEKDLGTIEKGKTRGSRIARRQPTGQHQKHSPDRRRRRQWAVFAQRDAAKNAGRSRGNSEEQIPL